MSEALYERYKEALRRGHVAAMRERHAAAIDAYSEAASIAPDRALPLVGLAKVLRQLGKDAEALAAFDAALDRQPADEGALRGRAEVLVARGDRAAAADALDHLAASLDAAGRLPDATDAARRALELAESRARRRSVTAYADRLRASDADPTAAEALTRALGVLQGTAIDVAVGPARGEGPRAGTDATAGADAMAAEAAPTPAPPFDPAAATAAVETLAETGDAEATVHAALLAAAGHRARGALGAAIDVCYLALAVSPADARLHVALTELYLDRGWRPLAQDKIALLRRLATLTDDTTTLEALAAIVATRLPEEARPSNGALA